jgi:prepilin signal peptidase PulO-like enzyme (type II secretory pathway)
METSLPFLLTVFGLALGSFIGALAYRLPRQESVFKGRSKCPKCKKKIAWYDNIPLLSYIFLGGKCRNCRKKISPRYFLIEFSTALAFSGSYFVYKSCLGALSSLVYQSPICLWQESLSYFVIPFILFAFLIIEAIFIIDFEHQFIPDQLVFWLFSFVFLVSAIFSPATLYQRSLSGFGAGIFLLVIHLLTKGKGMGLGDVKFALPAGILLSWPYTPVFLLLAFLTGAMVGIILILGRKVELKDHIAFGPFLAISLIITFIWGDKLITLFL